MTDSALRINLDEPRYDQSTFSGRAKHFLITTNPLNVLASSKSLEEAKTIVEKHRYICEREKAQHSQGMGLVVIWGKYFIALTSKWETKTVPHLGENFAYF